MNHETIRDYLIRADMKDGQAEALSRIFAEMATKSDLKLLRRDIDNLEERMRAEFSALRGEVRTELATVRGEFDSFRGDVRTDLATMRAEIATMRAELTWKMIAIVGFFATASAIFNVVAG